MERSERVGVVFLQTLHVRNWTSGKILEKLSSQFDVSVYTLDEDVANSPLWRETPTAPKRLNLCQSWLDKLIIALERHLAKDTLPPLRFKLMRHYLSDIRSTRGLPNARLKLLLTKGRHFCVAVLKSPVGALSLLVPSKFAVPLVKLLTTIQTRQSRWYAELQDLMEIDILLVPSAAQEPSIFQLIRQVKHLNPTIKIGMIMENWDNLTSKITFPTLPDFITVMNHRQVEQAKQLHGFPAESVVVAGLPKFEALPRHSASEFAPRPFGQRRLLYCGFSMPVREHEMVNFIAEVAKKFGFSEVHYRPHPARQFMPVDEPDLVPEIKINAVSDQEKVTGGGLPLINETYLNQFSDYDLVVAPPTTIAVEYICSGVPIVLDYRADRSIRTSPGNLVRNFPHINDFYQVAREVVFENREGLAELLDLYTRGALAGPRVSDLLPDEAFSSILMNNLKKDSRIESASQK